MMKSIKERFGSLEDDGGENTAGRIKSKMEKSTMQSRQSRRSKMEKSHQSKRGLRSGIAPSGRVPQVRGSHRAILTAARTCSI